jgi:2-polyprenyl-3-methyl-5-hydroxy-6-metoxy-1,4-benzoquinol methylase
MLAMNIIVDGLECINHENCYLCGREGKELYSGLEDVLYDVKGKWSFRKCTEQNCGLIWIDPMPVEKDIHKLYQRYYTHNDLPDGDDRSAIQKVIRTFYRMLLLISGIKRERQRQDYCYIADRRPGKLLEIGCGNGSRIDMIRKLGWDVEGQEIDGKSAEVARKNYQLKIHVGDLLHLGLSGNKYDAIIMHNVIEHVLEPVKLMAKCRELLKEGGELILITPNAGSLGHAFFRDAWRGLETPRHLFLYTTKSLISAAQKAGFTKIECWTCAAYAESLARESLKIRDNKKYGPGDYPMTKYKLLAVLFQLYAKLYFMFNPSSGEECVLRAVK